MWGGVHRSRTETRRQYEEVFGLWGAHKLMQVIRWIASIQVEAAEVASDCMQGKGCKRRK